MQTLVLYGSPHRNGDTRSLLDALLQELEGEADIVSAYEADIKPCIDCRWCWKNHGCAIQDGMQAVYEKLDSYDNIIVASPLYFSMLTGPLLSVGSRLQTLYAGRRFRKNDPLTHRKNGALLLVGGGDGGFGPAEDATRTLFRFLRCDLIGTALSHNTDETPAREDKAALEQAAALGRKLNTLHQQGK